MPLPANVQPGTGSLRVDSAFSVAFTGYTEPRLERASERFLRQLARETGFPLSLKPSKTGKGTLVIQTDHASKEIQEVGEDESYILDVSTASARLRATTPLGTMHGLQTFLQLVDVSPDGFAVPAATIQDKPRFPWRGLMIDSARHFIPVEVIRRNLDGMEAVKMNVFHWHLSENQGFRAESKRLPKLHELGSDGLYYTQEEIRDLIAYARDRGIRVVPEFDLPGHSTAWFVGHPELASGPGPYQIERRWGVFDPAFDPKSERTYRFLDLGWPAARHYAVDPMSGDAANLSPEEKQRILGGESCMWSEYVNAENVDSRIWPRNAAIAERLWSPEEVHDPASMYTRLDSISTRLELLGLTHRTHHGRMLHRIAGATATTEEFAALQTLTDQLEPVKDYTREQTAPAEPTSLTPMNRVVDALPLESDA